MNTIAEHQLLARASPAPPVRIVHIGLGAFSRSHTALYTAHAGDASEWGIAAYTGRSPALSDALAAQDGVYTLVERSSDGDSAEVIESIVRAHAGNDVETLLGDIAAESTAIITLTITEAGYRTTAEGEPDVDDALVLGDIDVLRRLVDGSAQNGVELATPLGRLVWGLELRRRRNGGPLAVVSCDNLPDNGGHVRRGVLSLSRITIPAVAEWCESTISFVSSSVDRITPQISSAELVLLRERYGDLAPVLTEPFRDWVLSGGFPAGRPDWESAGARFTDDLDPWEARKLWLLNGAHTLLANLGHIRGHTDVARAVADPVCRAAVEAFWNEAERHLPIELGVSGYRSALIERFANPRIVHHLAQIATDTPMKLRLRVAPVAERERNAARSADACATVIAAWVVADHRRDLASGREGSGGDAVSDEMVAARVATVSVVLGADRVFCRSVATKVRDLEFS